LKSSVAAEKNVDLPTLALPKRPICISYNQCIYILVLQKFLTKHILNTLVLVLTGNPGVGKHTVSKKLAKILGYEIVDVNKEAVKVGMPKQNDSIDVDVEKTQRILKEKISNKSLIVGHLAPFVVSKELVSMAFVLRKNPYELIQIYEKRNYSNKKKNDNLGSEILGVVAYDSIEKFGEDKTFQINTTSLTVEEVTKKIESVINGTFRGDTVDWLTEITTKNDLRKFFPD
jgi:adenylate kinase